jgi:invasion protein IalB
MSRYIIRTTFFTIATLGAVLAGTYHMATAQQSGAPAPSSIVETYGDWVVRCLSPEADTPLRVCEMTQELVQQETGQRILAASVRSMNDGANLTLIAPFGLNLFEGVNVVVADQFLVGMDFETCLPVGCVALEDLMMEQVGMLRAGEAMTVSMLNVDGQELALNLSLAGFIAAWDRLNEL